MRYLLIFALLVLTACANPDAGRALQAQDLLVGMPKKVLLSCAGVPRRNMSADLDEYLTYENVGVSYTQEGYPYFGLYGWHDHFGYGSAVPFDRTTDVTTTGCTATFTLHRGVVRQLVYAPVASGPLPLNMCYAIVRNCLPPVP